jgi:hypothetical protein
MGDGGGWEEDDASRNSRERLGPERGKMGQGRQQLEKGPASVSIFRCKGLQWTKRVIKKDVKQVVRCRLLPVGS